MKKLVVLLAIVFATTALIGCNKKKKEESYSMEGLNGVVSENIASVSQIEGQEVPVIVENADTYANQAAEPLAAAASAPSEKPTTKQIQQALKNAGFYNGKIDGNIGPKTKKAIEEFQAQNGLKADGKVGAKTWAALFSYLSKVVEVSNPSSDAQTMTQ